MNRQQFNGHNKSYNYRNGGDNRRNYHSRDQSQRFNWNERRGHEVRHGGRPTGYDRCQDSNQSSQLPGIVVQRNALAKPFDQTSDGSGDRANANGLTNVTAMEQKMADLDINVKDSKIEDKPTSVVSDQSVAVPEANANGSTGYTESKIESKPLTTVSLAPTNTPTQTYRRNTVSGDMYSGRKPFVRNLNQGFNPKPYQNQGFNAVNKYKFESNNKNFRSKPKVFPPPSQSTDFVPPMAPMAPVFYNLPDSCQLPHYFPNSFYPPVGYSLQPPIPNTGLDYSDVAITQKNIDADNNSKALDAFSAPNEPIPIAPHFVPFVPSPAYPEPPHYYGHIVTCKSEAGVFPFFICDFPNNIAPLQLQVNATGVPVLPCNCHLVQFNYVPSL